MKNTTVSVAETICKASLKKQHKLQNMQFKMKKNQKWKFKKTCFSRWKVMFSTSQKAKHWFKTKMKTWRRSKCIRIKLNHSIISFWLLNRRYSNESAAQYKRIKFKTTRICVKNGEKRCSKFLLRRRGLKSFLRRTWVPTTKTAKTWSKKIKT